MLRKPKLTHNALFDETKIKLLVYISKSRIHEGFLESTRDSLNPLGDRSRIHQKETIDKV